MNKNARKPESGKQLTKASELAHKLSQSRSLDASKKNSGIGAARGSRLAKKRKNTEIFETKSHSTQIVIDDDAALTYPHCVLPPHFFDRSLAHGDRAAALSVGPWSRRTVRT